jgi:hypothetical protein
MKHTDNLGTEIKVGDIVVSGGGKYANIHIGMVTKRNPTMVRCGEYDQINPKECLVITDKYKTEFPALYQKMYDENKKHFTADAKKPNPTMRYSIRTGTHPITSQVILTIYVFSNTDKVVTPLVQERLTRYSDGYSDIKVIRTTEGIKSWNRKLSNTLKVSKGGWPARKYVELPAKIIKKYFGEVPDSTEIVDMFDNKDFCLAYLKSIGVEDA